MTSLTDGPAFDLTTPLTCKVVEELGHLRIWMGWGTGMSEAKILELFGMILDGFLPKGSELVANFVNQMVLSTKLGNGGSPFS